MKFRHSLRYRIIIAYGLFGAIFSAIFASAVYISLDYIDDTLIDNRLLQEIEIISFHLEHRPGELHSSSTDISAYIGTKHMPSKIKQSISNLKDGLHELHVDGAEYHIAVATLPAFSKPLYLLYDVSVLEFTEKRKLQIRLVLISGVLFVILAGIWIGYVTSGKVLAPVIYLADEVRHAVPEKLATDLSKSFFDDEVGFLARELEHTMKRMNDFIEREKRFTRDASHELRTPVTIIKGAVEVIKNQLDLDGKAVLPPVSRIERSVNDMENIINAFLWLGREEPENKSSERCEIAPIIAEVIDHQRHLFADKPILIECNTVAEPVIHAPAPLFRIVINNLIQNAFQHMQKGKITVRICEDHISIVDTGMGILASDLPKITQLHVRGGVSSGFGIGLTIVKRICNRFGWRYRMESKPGEGTSVRLIFSV